MGRRGKLREDILYCVCLRVPPNLAPTRAEPSQAADADGKGTTPASQHPWQVGRSAFNTCPFGLQRIRHAAPGNRGPQTEGKEAGKGSFLKRVPPNLFPQWPLPLGWYPARTVFTASQSQVHPCPPHHRALQSPVTAPLILLRKM